MLIQGVKLSILEGPRCTGKSSVAQLLRQQINYTTLINYTGFKEDGVVGHNKIKDYYFSWMDLFENLNRRLNKYHFIFDRFFLSEIVFSKLYKSYDFKSEGIALLERLNRINSVDIFHLTYSDVGSILDRTNREKTLFVNTNEDYFELSKQKSEYDSLFKFIEELNLSNIRLHLIDTLGKSVEEVKEEIKTIIER